ncbi:hypothetical protein F5884DRAFT_867188 [Xylogone sp. PMI_703]|nr:hypothetical protein F5884DRAFT_867188 [Xylogone sp. PMI_703]
MSDAATSCQQLEQSARSQPTYSKMLAVVVSLYDLRCWKIGSVFLPGDRWCCITVPTKWKKQASQDVGRQNPPKSPIGKSRDTLHALLWLQNHCCFFQSSNSHAALVVECLPAEGSEQQLARAPTVGLSRGRALGRGDQLMTVLARFPSGVAVQRERRANLPSLMTLSAGSVAGLQPPAPKGPPVHHRLLHCNPGLAHGSHQALADTGEVLAGLLARADAGRQGLPSLATPSDTSFQGSEPYQSRPVHSSKSPGSGSLNSSLTATTLRPAAAASSSEARPQRATNAMLEYAEAIVIHPSPHANRAQHIVAPSSPSRHPTSSFPRRPPPPHPPNSFDNSEWLSAWWVERASPGTTSPVTQSPSGCRAALKQHPVSVLGSAIGPQQRASLPRCIVPWERSNDATMMVARWLPAALCWGVSSSTILTPASDLVSPYEKKCQDAATLFPSVPRKAVYLIAQRPRRLSRQLV